jgi:hypothetical protein
MTWVAPNQAMRLTRPAGRFLGVRRLMDKWSMRQFGRKTFLVMRRGVESKLFDQLAQRYIAQARQFG